MHHKLPQRFAQYITGNFITRHPTTKEEHEIQYKATAEGYIVEGNFIVEDIRLHAISGDEEFTSPYIDRLIKQDIQERLDNSNTISTD